MKTQVMNIGEILRRAGVVSQADIDFAVEVQRSTGARLGEALVHIEACSSQDLMCALDRQGRLGKSTAIALKAVGEILVDGLEAAERVANRVTEVICDAAKEGDNE